MTTTYTVIKNTAGDTLSIRRNDGASIPVCEGNRDYAQYLIDTATSPAPIEVMPDPVADTNVPIEQRVAALEMAEIERMLTL